MKAGLYDVLRGRFHDGSGLNTVAENDQRLYSVMSNLNRLFNARQGSIAHLPDYGLPDASAVYLDAPFAIDGLRQAVKQAVQTYEPRLKKVYVEVQHAEGQDMRANFIITGELQAGERVKFQTTFSADDLVHVRRWTRPE